MKLYLYNKNDLSHFMTVHGEVMGDRAILLDDGGMMSPPAFVEASSKADFSEKTEEDFMDYIKTQNSIPLRLLKGESYRLRFFRAPDGRFGIYGTFSHLALDTIAIFIFYKDLLCVYKSLRDKTELPKPLYRYEDAMQKDFEIFRNKEKHRKNVEFYNDYFTREKPSFFAGVDQMRDLKKTRKFFNSPDFFKMCKSKKLRLENLK